ncbi:Panacea domain-containing protein [Pasteurella atlantica]|uniref:Panacea domain-containing protein n=1 Tax=Pasteurellaceae TaxID=712 RepID=UPI00276EDD77|nr:type II toxin-antitoxin system antitoxin SocA domain-containing protein [Pasteurella atlantica]MDP8099284.1 DUF4065 domain-containing protein [Pasteurella atlantica]MDP8100338.1 DUF4065 domain-containing protein [Pasteurella atlantica]MDP8106157.1 DUF4065 domain-containing protein [Pasteurella atlantica]MDP8115882.1 DUF4065 domain-containing protein [Pasteurella atlantica]
MNNALLVAQYIIHICNERNIPITHLKLQKLLYFVQANFLFNTRQPCFNDKIIALPYGPVVESVFNHFRMRGVGASNLVDEETFDINNLQHIELIDETLDELANFDAFQLVDITHKQSPWRNAFNHATGSEITSTAIRDYFDE